MRTFFPLIVCLALTPLALLSTGCNNVVADSCDLLCDCNSCNDREYDECIAEGDGASDIASAYGCDVEFEDYSICAIEEFRCTAGFWGPDPGDPLACARDYNNLDDCIDRGSRLR